MRILIQSMKVGDSGYTSSSALDAVQDKSRLWWWLRGDYPVTDSLEGTLRMRIERRKDGFHVWPLEDETYFPSNKKSPQYNLCATVHDGKTTSKPLTEIKEKLKLTQEKIQQAKEKLKAKPTKLKSKPTSKRLSEDLEPVQRRNLELKKN